MPEHVAAAFRPPKSAAAVPDMSEWTPVTAATMSRAESRDENGMEKSVIAMTAAIMSIKAKTGPRAVPRRD